MKARDVSFIAIVAVVIIGVCLLSLVGKARDLPADESHYAAQTRAQCLACHRPERLTTLEHAEKHPAQWRNDKLDCATCHQRRAPSWLSASGR